MYDILHIKNVTIGILLLGNYWVVTAPILVNTKSHYWILLHLIYIPSRCHDDALNFHQF